jgi:uncharacterized protein (TIGR02145 family)
MKRLYKNYLMIICLLTLSILSTKVNAQHFNFEGGNPSEPFWTIYIAEATLNDVDLEAGDEIAIFDGEIMVGAISLTQVCTPENQFDNVLLAFNTLVSGNNGYTPGNNVLFKCWDASLEIEISDFEISYDNPYGDAWTQNVFPAENGEYSLIHLDFEWIHTGNLAGTITDEINAQPIAGALVEVSGNLSYNSTTNANGNYQIEDIESGIYSVTASAEGYFPKTINGLEILAGETTTLDFALEPIIQTQTFNLTTGFQFASTRIIIDDPNMQNVLEGILDNLDFVRNSEGYMLRKIGPNWVNNIGDWVTTEGYLFKMNNTDSFEISGETIEEYTPIELYIGFQIISYLSSEPRDCEEVFTYVLDNLDFVRNTGGNMLRKIGSFWINNIGDMQNGEGYLVKMLADDILIFTSCGNPFIDPRDGQNYNTVQIGTQCWMAENINYETSNSWCYNNNANNCVIYGRLYDWYPALSACPPGWHTPTYYDWTILTNYLGENAGGKIKESGTVHWISPNAGATNESGFTALPGGCHNSNGFENLTSHAYFWSSSEYNSYYAWSSGLRYNHTYVTYSTMVKDLGFSVRCLRD